MAQCCHSRQCRLGTGFRVLGLGFLAKGELVHAMPDNAPHVADRPDCSHGAGHPGPSQVPQAYPVASLPKLGGEATKLGHIGYPAGHAHNAHDITVGLGRPLCALQAPAEPYGLIRCRCSSTLTAVARPASWCIHVQTRKSIAPNIYLGLHPRLHASGVLFQPPTLAGPLAPETCPAGASLN